MYSHIHAFLSIPHISTPSSSTTRPVFLASTILVASTILLHRYSVQYLGFLLHTRAIGQLRSIKGLISNARNYPSFSPGFHGSSVIIGSFTSICKGTPLFHDMQSPWGRKSTIPQTRGSFLCNDSDMFPLLDNLDSIFTLSNLVCTLEVWFHATSCVYWYSPLTTLRDKLVVALQDAEGNEISNTGIETRLVIEKGIWDDIFPLEGGGHVHMKLQFLLSEDDRQRIRNMRESALQNKHDEFSNSVLESPEHNITTSSNVASPSKLSSEASVLTILPTQTAQADIASMSHLTLTNKGKVGPEDVERSCSDQMQNNRDRPGDAEALSQNSNFLSKEVSPSCAVEKNETVGSLPPLCSRIIGSVDSPKSEAPEKPNGDRANNPNKQNSQNKTPTNVRKMITAFESSLNQDMKPQTRPSSIRSQSRKTWVEADQNSSQLNEERTKKNIPVRSLSGNFRSLLHTDDDVLSSTPSQYTKKSESRAEHLLTKEKYVYFKNNYTTMDHEVDIEKEKMSSEKLTRASTSERASARGRTLHEHVSVSGNLYYMRGQGSNLLLKENAKETHIKGSQGYLDIRGASGDSNYLLESSGGWTFPDGGGKRPCLTAGGKRMTNLMGDLSTDNKSPTGKTNFSEAENMKKCNVPGTTRLEPKGSEETSQGPQKRKSGDSTDSETSTGPLGQVVKVAIMVGFATLVLFTRQRNPGR